MSDFLGKSMLAIICRNFTFSTIFSINNGHRAIKVYVLGSNIAGLVIFYDINLKTAAVYPEINVVLLTLSHKKRHLTFLFMMKTQFFKMNWIIFPCFLTDSY